VSRAANPGVTAAFDPAALTYGADGLLPVVVQDVGSGAVLMLAWADRRAVERTLESGLAHFWSRSRQAPWQKGETSGHVLRVAEVRHDCDGDALLYRADPVGPTCHTGARSCFETVDAATAGPLAGPRLELGWLWDVVDGRRGAAPEESYTARLLAAGVDRVARKVGEEATETVIAALRADVATPAGEDVAAARSELAGEAADLLYHLLVLLAAAGSDPAEVAAELRRRHGAPRGARPPKPEEAPPAGGDAP
jgi:phosphoribosyl-ATP pyrophosphohydrolase/phosphoribosyl-AMP cyclohydrolase